MAHRRSSPPSSSWSSLAGKPDESGLTLFAIQPQDVAGSWNNNLGVVNLQYGPAISYPLILAFFFSLLQANWTYTGYDASAHVAEETVGARVASAWGLFLSVAVSRGRRVHLPGRTLDPPAEPVDALPASPRRHDAADRESVLLRWRRRGHRHPRAQPRPARRRAGGRASRSPWRSAASRRSPRPAGCCIAFSRDDGAARIRLAQEGLAPLPHAGQLADRDRRRSRGSSPSRPASSAAAPPS